MTIEPPAWMQNNAYSARLDRQLIFNLWDEGVMDVAAYKVTQTGNGEPSTVTVAAGVAVVLGTEQADQGSYLVKSTGAEVVPLTTRPGTDSRYDLIVLQVRDENAGGGFTEDDAVISVVTGAVSSSPSPPAVPDSALLLAIIGPITPGTTAITNSIITDARVLAGRKAAPGTIESYSGSEAWIPNGWLVEDGRAVDRTAYPRLNALYAAMGYPYGVGNGTSTFNLRDKRGRVGIALDNMGGVDAGRIGAANVLGGTGGVADNNLPYHTHVVDPPLTGASVSDPGHTHRIDHDHGNANTAATNPPGHTHSGTAYSYGQSGQPGIMHQHQAESGFNFVVASGNPGGGIDIVPSSTGSADQKNLTGWGGDHSHQVGTGGPNESLGHLHSVDLPNFVGTSLGANTNASASVDIPAFTSGPAGSNPTDGNIPPYILELSLVRT